MRIPTSEDNCACGEPVNHHEDWPHDPDDDEIPTAGLYVPDPESISGWGMRMVWRKSSPNKPKRIGFGR